MPSNLPLLLVFTGLATFLAGAIGYILGRGRPRASDLERIDTLVKELEAARAETQAAETRGRELDAELAASREEIDASRAGIDTHFEGTAALFGRLAQDYRALFDHFAESAERLGVSDAQTRALVDGVREKLLAEPASLAENADAGDATAPVEDGSGEPGADVASETTVERSEAAAGETDDPEVLPGADATGAVAGEDAQEAGDADTGDEVADTESASAADAEPEVAETDDGPVGEPVGEPIGEPAESPDDEVTIRRDA